MLVTVKQYINAIRYQYYNDVQFMSKLKTRKMPLDSFIVQVLTSPAHKKAFRDQYRLWAKKTKKDLNSLLKQVDEGINDN